MNTNRIYFKEKERPESIFVTHTDTNHVLGLGTDLYFCKWQYRCTYTV